jgi:tetratricopeptide (TPR) repeat protein
VARSLAVLFSAVGIVVLAVVAYQRNLDYRSNVTIWRKVLDVRPDNFRAYNFLITELLKEQKTAEAEQMSKRMLEKVEAKIHDKGPRYVLAGNSLEQHRLAALNLLGQSLLCSGHAEDAMKCFSEILAVKADDRSARHNKALTYVIQGKMDEAIQELESVVSSNPGSKKAHLVLASLLEGKGLYARAKEHYLRSLEADAGFLTAKYRLAWLLATCPDESVRDGRLAVDLALAVCKATSYASVIALNVLAAAFAEENQFDKAVDMTRQAVHLSGEYGYTSRMMPGVSDSVDDAYMKSWNKDIEGGGPQDLEARIKQYGEKRPFRMRSTER